MNQASQTIITNLVQNSMAQDKVATLAALADIHYADIASFIDNASVENRHKLINLIAANLPADVVANILMDLDHSVMQSFIDILGQEVSHSVFAVMDPDQIIYVLKELDEDKRQKIITLLDQEQRLLVVEGLSFPENSAGRIMRKQVVLVSEHWTIAQTINHLRSNLQLPVDFYEIFVVNDQRCPVGSVLVSRLIRGDEDLVITEIMKQSLQKITPDMDQEEVSYLFSKYGVVSAPVIGKDGQVIGVISIDDIVDVIEEEADEDIMRMAGVHELDLYAPFLDVVKHRFPWLFINLITACITSWVISRFENAIHQMAVLAAIMPVVASMGGNAGMQTLTVMVRAIAHRELTAIGASRVILKEVIASSINGAILASLGGAMLLLINHNLHLSMVFAAATVTNFTMAGFLGSFIPAALCRLGVDPAAASSVFITALTDIIGFFAFLGLAVIFLL